MHKEYVVVGDDVYVTNETGEMKKYNNSFVETLETQNSMEYLDDLIAYYEKEIKFYNDEYKNRRKMSTKFLIFIFIIATILEIITNASFSLFIPASLVGSGIIIGNITNKIIAKINNDVLTSKLTYAKQEKRKLLLTQNKLIKDKPLENGVIKKVDSAAHINVLRKQLELIDLYKTNKSKYLTYYKSGCLGIYLSYLGYHGDSIDFVVYLVEQDLGIKQKQKLLKNK